ncbi:MAG: phytoene/squalene synthase family protein [Rubrivivax sp.]|nr:phytoene/squalene synthase family protein [Rubrivivax sp.]
MPADIAWDRAACRQLMRGGSKSFFAASLLLPPRVRAPATAIYAFCRRADDLIDLGGNPAAAMASLRQRLDGIYAGTPQDIDCDLALAAIVQSHRIPRVLLDALLEGFLWDTDGRQYDTLAELEAYAARVAGTVGAMMALVMHTTHPQAVARACELGVAMQLTNIARDVGEDARNGRLYLPRQWLHEVGIQPQAWLQAPVFDARLAQVIERLLAAADALYLRAEHGIAALPRDCRPAIRAARLVYAEIGQQLRRSGHDAIGQRTVVPTRRKLALMARASAAALHTPGDAQQQFVPLPAIQFLVHATGRPATLADAVAHNPDGRVGWVLELFERQAAARLQR